MHVPHAERGFGQLSVTNLSMYIDNKYLFIQDFLLKEFLRILQQCISEKLLV